MTSDEIWDMISKIKRDPCTPKYQQTTFVTASNPYATDAWKTQRDIYIEVLKYCKNDAKTAASAIDEAQSIWAMNINMIEQGLQEILDPYGRVSSVEVEASNGAMQSMRVEFDVATRISFDAIRNRLLELPWVHRVTHIDFNTMALRLTIIIEIDTFAFERRNNMPPKTDYSGYFAVADNMHKPPESIADMMSKFFTGPSIRIKQVMFNGPATIVYWSDDTKTIVKCMEDEEFDPEKGLAMAICKRLYGGDFHRVFKDSLKNAETRKGDEAKRARKLRVTRAKIKSVK